MKLYIITDRTYNRCYYTFKEWMCKLFVTQRSLRGEKFEISEIRNSKENVTPYRYHPNFLVYYFGFVLTSDELELIDYYLDNHEKKPIKSEKKLYKSLEKIVQIIIGEPKLANEFISEMHHYDARKDYLYERDWIVQKHD